MKHPGTLVVYEVPDPEARKKSARRLALLKDASVHVLSENLHLDHEVPVHLDQRGPEFRIPSPQQKKSVFYVEENRKGNLTEWKLFVSSMITQVLIQRKREGLWSFVLVEKAPMPSDLRREWTWFGDVYQGRSDLSGGEK